MRRLLLAVAVRMAGRMWALLALALALGLGAAEPPVSEEEMPRVPATSPDNAPGTFRVVPGFRLELVAAEPLVVDPIAMSFDEEGRLFVVEMRDYSERRPERLGRIRCLEDVNGDGRFDRSTVYVDGLPWPTAVICYGGGVFVGTTPDILYCRDMDGDGVAEQREVVFTGFASDYAPYATNKLNVQAMLNSFQWGIDNRIHGATSLSGGRVTSPKRPEVAAVELRGRDFSFDPRTLELRAETGGGQHGLSFDDTGRKYVCHNSSHAQMLMYAERYVGGNPHYAPPRALVDIAADGPAAEVFRVSPDEPWRVIRTRWRVAGLVPGPVEGGGRASGYFTSATGITIYRGDAFPEGMRGDLFVADCGSNLLHRKRLEASGVEMVARRPAGEEKVEFLACTDNWFRPVQMANAPDGTLYIADMYREIIEHPWSLPASIKERLDLNSGNDRGRIYRVVPDTYRQRPLPRLGRATTAELVATLEHRNGWHRDTAARLLVEWGGTNAVAGLSRLARESGFPLARVHALRVLASLDALTAGQLTLALRDAAPVVRRHAVELSESVVAAGAPGARALVDALPGLAADPDPLVRYQLAWTLGNVAAPARSAALTTILRQAPEWSWMQAAVLNSLTAGASTMFVDLLARPPWQDPALGREFLRRLAGMVGAAGQASEWESVLRELGRRSEDPETLGYVARLLAGVRDPAGRKALDRELSDFLAQAQRLLTERRLPEPLRLGAVELIAQATPSWGPETLVTVLTADQSERLQAAVVEALLQPAGTGAVVQVVSRWDQLSPSVRSQALELFLRRADRTQVLLQAVRDGRINRRELTVAQVEALRRSSDASVQLLARRIFGDRNTGRRADVVRAFEPALQLTGDAARGRLLYRERCASCHRLAGEGHAVGPDLVTVKSSGPDVLLSNILDPNREVAPRYLNYVIETEDSESVSGLVVGESAAAVTLRGANGVETTVARPRIRRFQGSNESMMPEGLEEGWKPQQLADLLQFLRTAE